MPVKMLQPTGVSKPIGLYSHGADAAGVVVVAGQVGLRADGQLAGSDVGSQTTQAFANVAAVLAAAGCTMRDVVRFQTFLTSREDLPGFMAARAEALPAYFPGGAYPPNTLLVVSGLVRPELRVEIEAMAVKPSRASAPAVAARSKARTTPRRTATTRGAARRPSRRR